MRRFAVALATTAAFASLSAAPARASEFCVHSQAEIQAALTTAQTNNEDDYVYIVAGNYALSAALTFSSTEPHKLWITGGADSTCSTFTMDATTLDGQHLVRPLYVANAIGGIQITFLTIAGGSSSSNSGGGLIAASDSGNILIALNRFVGNRTMAIAGGLYATSSSGSVSLRNNLLLANRGGEVGGAVISQGSGESYVIGNTIVANTSDQASDPGGLIVTGNAHFTLSNNILWNNAGTTGSDFATNSVNSRLTNDIGIIAPGTPGTVTDELSVDPQFAPCGGFICLSFELSRSSPLVDVGTDDPPGGETTVDLAWKPRKIGPHVDIGAYENDLIFANDFE